MGVDVNIRLALLTFATHNIMSEKGAQLRRGTGGNGRLDIPGLWNVQVRAAGPPRYALRVCCPRVLSRAHG